MDNLPFFTPRYDFFVGIDYDGTIFDSMTIKHRDVFIPVFLEVWPVGAHKKELTDIWEKINLYSQNRGINRYAGLLKCFEAMKEIMQMPDYDSLSGFVGSGKPLSGGGLAEYRTEYPSAFLNQVMRWSEESDRLFQKLIKGKAPFDYAAETIAAIAGQADVMVISSASSASIVRDLGENNLLGFVAAAAGQEMGDKVRQLECGAVGKYRKDRILMVGDAPGDRSAALAVNGLFYPIIPTREAESWRRLREEGFGRFINGGYAGEYEEGVIAEFERVLL